ncbi:peroxidase TAP [Periconia macrospinosa]|uniref:Peroxidase TAP n=1 Tax=Periconia macrospinosa TaxID=97972 RepID=A0A2V1DEJ5_9PLEO|nr:peroxidase TAP [Periconia macrospinosa]
MSVTPFSLANVQGDVLFGLPKQTEKFMFFRIDEVDGFRTNLTNLIPLITTAEQTKGNISEIRQTKARIGISTLEGDGETVHPAVVTVSGVNIAFSAKGLSKIGLTETIGDSLFQSGQRADAEGLGDEGTGTGSSYQPKWDADFLQEIHGVALITGDSHETVDEKLKSVKDLLSGSIKELHTITGDVRPDDQKGHEHFGYKDGISNPAVDGVDSLKPGQATIDQGTALFGRGADSSKSRPAWALDGSLMVFRKLSQQVPEFDKFLLDTAGSQAGADLMGARFVGRWKSGAPLMISPSADDAVLGADAERNNDFRFVRNDQSKCPFHAHIRKMVPRGDSLPDEELKKHMILRRGIPFGPEVSEAEKTSGTTSSERGLLFVCYQTNLADGFKLLQQGWANNVAFPPGSSPTPGQDPLIGQTKDESPRIITGAFANDTSKPLTLLQHWVDSKGGEYFFTPSIPTLKNVIAKA